MSYKEVSKENFENQYSYRFGFLVLFKKKLEGIIRFKNSRRSRGIIISTERLSSWQHLTIRDKAATYLRTNDTKRRVISFQNTLYMGVSSNYVRSKTINMRAVIGICGAKHDPNLFQKYTLVLTTLALLGCDLIISGLVAPLSNSFREVGRRGELSSLGEVAGLLLPVGGRGIFTLLASFLFSLR